MDKTSTIVDRNSGLEVDEIYFVVRRRHLWFRVALTSLGWVDYLLGSDGWSPTSWYVHNSFDVPGSKAKHFTHADDSGILEPASGYKHFGAEAHTQLNIGIHKHEKVQCILVTTNIVNYCDCWISPRRDRRKATLLKKIVTSCPPGE